jgi:hypothetical protein
LLLRQREGMMGKIILGTGSIYGPGNTERGQELVAIPDHALMHGLVTGKSGYGKSYFIASLVVVLLSSSVQVILLDPHGETSKLVLHLLLSTNFFNIYPDAYSRLLYLNLPLAASQQRYLPFNILRTNLDPYTASDPVLEAFRRAFPSLKGGTYINIETLVKIGAFVLAAHNLPLLPYLYYLFTDALFRERLLADITDDVVQRSFAQYGFTRTGDIPAAMQPTIKRINQWAMIPALRYSLGQQQNFLDPYTLLANKQSAIINLNLSSPDAMRIIGCLFMAFMEMAVSTRATGAQKPRPCMLLIDEFHNFIAHSGDTMSKVFEEFRKRHVYLTGVHQHWGQIPESLQGALNQCEIVTTFHLERSDAKLSAELLDYPYDEYLPKPVFANPRRPHAITPQFYSRTEQRDMFIDAITKLNKREAFIKLPSHETGSVLYKMRTLNVDTKNTDTNDWKGLKRYILSSISKNNQTSKRKLPHNYAVVFITRQMMLYANRAIANSSVL